MVKRTLYELTGKDDRRFSPYCWRTRLALAHKGLETEYVACGFTEKDKIAFSGSDKYPVLVDGETIVHDSWTIAGYLDSAYPDKPSLFGGEGGQNMAFFLNTWTDTQLHPALLRTIIWDVFHHINDADIDYFRTDREKRFGQTLESLRDDQEARSADLENMLQPLRLVLRKRAWFSGNAPAYGDYIVFGALQWPRCVSPFPVVKPDDPIYEWRNRMIGLYDNMADSVTHYDY